MYVMIVKQSKITAVRTPLTKKILAKGQVLAVDEFEGKKLTDKSYIVACDEAGVPLFLKKTVVAPAPAAPAPAAGAPAGAPAGRRARRRAVAAPAAPATV